MATKRLTPAEKVEQEWTVVEQGFRRMLDCLDKSKNVPPQDRLDIYSSIISAVQNSRLETVFERSRQMVENYLKDQASEELGSLEGIELLGACFKAWQRHQIVVRWMTCVFGYIEEVSTKRQQSGQDSGVRKMTLRCFYTGLYMTVKAKLRKVLLDQVHNDREGGVIDREAVKNCVDLFVQMGLDDMPVYETELQAAYLEDVENFFRSRTAKWLSEPDGVITFPERAERTILDEQKRVRELLHPSSEVHVMKAVETEILRKNQDRILNDSHAGLKALLVQWKEGDLGRLFRVFGPTAVNEMAVILREHVKLEGGELNQKLCSGGVDGKGYVEEALAIYKRYSTLLRVNFTNDSAWEAMSKALREAFEVFLNATLMVVKKAPAGAAKDPKKEDTKVKVTSAELVSTYFDNLLTGGQKNEGSEIENLLDDATQLFFFVAEKDLFQEFYRNQLSKRLLQDKSSDEDERTAISKLKMKMGAPFTSKMEGMLNDKNHNEELIKKFKTFCVNKGMKADVDFTAQVLTTGHWPSFKVDDINLPEVLVTPLTNFTIFYQNDAQSKKLKWVHCLGSATVSGKFKKGPKEFMVSTYQACILLQFNEADKRTLSELLDSTRLGDAECRAAIASLALSKTQVLKKISGAPKKIEPSDEFQFNDDFADPRRKIKIPVAITASTSTPVEKTDEARRHVTDACIVRIMKARKQMAHGELQAECLRQLNATFRPDPKLIKKRIEDLIQRQYLERDSDDRNIYRYLA